MPTQRPLREMVPELAHYIRKHENTIEEHKKLFDLYDRQLLKYLNPMLYRESSKPHIVKELLQRASALNFLPKIINKKSTIYDVAPNRVMEDQTGQETFEALKDAIDLDVQMQHLAELVQLNGAAAIEPFLTTTGKPKLRILPLHQFLMYSDDPKDLKNPTVFIKFIGTILKEIPTADTRGIRRKDDETHIEEVAVFHIYSDDEFLVIHRDGTIDEQAMLDMESEGVNELGRLPVVYVNCSKTEIIPNADTSRVQNTTLIPMMLTDLNYATKYQSHSIIAVTGAEPANVPAGPGDIWYIAPREDAPGELATPNVEVVQPNVDTDKAVNLILQQVMLWLDLEGVKIGSVGTMDNANLASGVSKMIDEADASEEISKLKQKFQHTEADLYELLQFLHNDYWTGIQGYDITGRLPEEAPTLEFGARQILQDSKLVTDEQILLLEHKLTSRKRALKRIHPNLTDTEIEDLIKEIDEDSEEAIRKFQESEVFNATSTNNDEDSQVDSSIDEPSESNE